MISAEFTVAELFAVLIARDLREDDRVIMVGANQPMARAGAAMANMTRLPDARVMVGFSIGSLAGMERASETLPFTLDPRTLQGGEAWVRQGELFDQSWMPEVFFFGGYEVDRRGNVNLIGIPDGRGGWRLRGPGPLAQPSISTHCRGYYILMTHHEPQTFVERVACVSALGDRSRRRELGLPGGGPRMVISPLGTFDFGEDGDMRVRTLHEGVSAADLRAATGFDLRCPDPPGRTIGPSAAELAFLRARVDPSGTLRDAKPR